MTLRASDVMERNVLSASPDMTLAALEDFLIGKRISGVPVIEHGAVVGIISRSDVVRSLSLERSLAGLVAEGFTPAEDAGASVRLPAQLEEQLSARTVRDAMVSDPITVSPDTPVADIARLLHSRHIHRVLVTEGKTVRGVISTLDLVRLIADGVLRDVPRPG